MTKNTEIEELRRDAERRSALAWAELVERLSANATGDHATRIYAAEARAIRLVCLMRLAAPTTSKGRSRTSRWDDRARVLARLDDALLDYIGAFPVGSVADLPWSLAARDRATALRGHIREEIRWRRDREARVPTPPGVAPVEWSPTNRPGPKTRDAFVAIAALVREYGIGARDLALLESVARLPGEPFGSLDGAPLLRAWNPEADDYLFLPPGESRFDSLLQHDDLIKRWEKRLKDA